jgi:hypothetical protein
MAMGIAGPLRARSATRLRGLARFGPVNRLGHVLGVGGAGPVPRRVAALLAPPPRIRPLLVVAVASVVLVSSVAALDAARDLHAVVELAQTHVFNDPT